MTSDGLAACCPCSKTAKCKSVKCPCFIINKPCVSCASTLSGKCENKQHVHFSESVEKLDEPGKAVDGSPESGFDADSFVDDKMREAFGASMVREEVPIDDFWTKTHVAAAGWKGPLWQTPMGRPGEKFTFIQAELVEGMRDGKFRSERVLLFTTLVLKVDKNV